MKELNHFVLGIILTLCFHKRVKGHSDNPEVQVEVETLNRKSFLKVKFKLRKAIFFKKVTFDKASDSRTLYLSEIGPAFLVYTGLG